MGTHSNNGSRPPASRWRGESPLCTLPDKAIKRYVRGLRETLKDVEGIERTSFTRLPSQEPVLVVTFAAKVHLKAFESSAAYRTRFREMKVECRIAEREPVRHVSLPLLGEEALAAAA